MLCILRIIQGIAAGGEFSSAAVFVYEGVNAEERGKYAGYLVSGKTLYLYYATLHVVVIIIIVAMITSPFSGANAGTSLGVIVATSIRRGTSDQELDSWGWRIPFLLTPVVGGIALYFLYQLGEYEEDKEFQEAKTKSQENDSNKSNDGKIIDGMIHDNHMWIVLKKYRWEILLLMVSLGSWSPMVNTFTCAHIPHTPHTHTHIYIHTYIHTYTCMHVYIYKYRCTDTFRTTQTLYV